MPIWLKQSTARAIGFGPFLDETDGKTAETGLSISTADIRLKKGEANWAQKNSAQLLLHEENGWYEISLDTTDTATLGELIIAVHKSGALPVWDKFMVVPANIYDSVVGGTTVLNTNASQWGGASTSTDDVALLASTAVLNANTVQWAGASTSTNDIALIASNAVVSANAVQWNGASTSTSDLALLADNTVFNVNTTQWAGASTSTNDIALVASGVLDVNVVQWSGASASTNDLALVASSGGVLDANVVQWSGASTSTNDLALVASTGGVLDANVVQWNGESTSTSDLAILPDSTILSANVKQVNDVTVNGTGALGDEWGP